MQGEHSYEVSNEKLCCLKMLMAQGICSISKNQPGGELATGEPTWYRKLRDSSWSSS